MDFFELLVLLFFIVIPLLQGFLRRGSDGTEEAADRTAEAPHEEAHPLPDDDEPLAGSTAPPAEGWSMDWGEWPGEHVAPEPEDVPEAVRVSAPVVSLEQLQIDREAEHRRLHHTHSRPARRDPAREARVAALLADSRDLRRAIILGEVLGPPPALRDLPHT